MCDNAERRLLVEPVGPTIILAQKWGIGNNHRLLAFS